MSCEPFSWRRCNDTRNGFGQIVLAPVGAEDADDDRTRCSYTAASGLGGDWLPRLAATIGCRGGPCTWERFGRSDGRAPVTPKRGLEYNKAH
ncbi:unnamed protein product [Lota lota]